MQWLGSALIFVRIFFAASSSITSASNFRAQPSSCTLPDGGLSLSAKGPEIIISMDGIHKVKIAEKQRNKKKKKGLTLVYKKYFQGNKTPKNENHNLNFLFLFFFFTKNKFTFKVMFFNQVADQLICFRKDKCKSYLIRIL